MIKFEELPPMEEACYECKGTGLIDCPVGKKKNAIKVCKLCGSRGKVLSDFGKALIKLMDEYRPWTSDIDDVRNEIPVVQKRYDSLWD